MIMPLAPETLPFIFSMNPSRSLSTHPQSLVSSHMNISFVHFASICLHIFRRHCFMLLLDITSTLGFQNEQVRFVCVYFYLSGRWWSVTSQSPRLYIAHSVGWRPITLPYLKWVQSSSTSRNTLQHCTAWWSVAPTSFQNRFQTSSVSHRTCEANLCTLFS